MLSKQCGEGAFGLVMMGEAVDIGSKKGTTPVAVKMLKGNQSNCVLSFNRQN